MSTFTLDEVDALRADALEKGRRQGASEERARVIRCYDDCFVHGVIREGDMAAVLQRFALMLARGAEP